MTQNATPVAGGSLVDVATFATGDPTHIDPALATDASSAQIASLVYEGLTRLDAKGEVLPGIASSYTSNADHSQWTFTLRPTATFSNGEPVLPSNFVAGWLRALNLARTSGSSTYLNIITGATAVLSGDANGLSGAVPDDAGHTLAVTLTRPTPDFAAMVATPSFDPMPKGTMADMSADGKLTALESGVMIGDGPFEMNSPWTHSDNITLVRNNTYYGTKPYLDSVKFKISRNEPSAVAAFNAGQADIGTFDPLKFQGLPAAEQSATVTDPLLATDYWGFNMNDPAVGGAANLLLRRAIDTTLDHKGMSIDLFDGVFNSASSWAPPVTPGYLLQQVSSGTRNVEAAKDILRQWAKPLPAITVSYPNNSDVIAAEATRVKSNLQDVGITAALQPLTPDALAAAMQRGQVQMFYGVWQAPYMSYDAMLLPFVGNNTAANVFHYSNAAFDAGINTARAASTADASDAVYRQAGNAMLADQPVSPNQWLASTITVAARARGVTVDPMGKIHYQAAWLQP